MDLQKDIDRNGYKKNSPYRHNPFLTINSGHISMANVPHAVFGVDNLGNQRMMYSGDNDHFFQGNSVMEFPVKRNGGTFSSYIFQDGGEVGIDPETAKQILQESQDLTDEQRTYLAQIAGTDEYGNELENVDEDIQEDESMEEYKKGGGKKTSHKNIQRNRNDLFQRNYDAFGEAGVKNYKPKLEDGGGLTDSFLKKTIDLHTAELQKKSKPENNIQSTTTDSYIAGKQDQFSKYLKANLMSNLVKEEHQFMLQLETKKIMKMGGANLLKFTAKYQMGGPSVGNPYAGMTREQQILAAGQLNGQNNPQSYPVNPADFSVNPMGYYSPFATMGPQTSNGDYSPQSNPNPIQQQGFNPYAYNVQPTGGPGVIDPYQDFTVKNRISPTLDAAGTPQGNYSFLDDVAQNNKNIQKPMAPTAQGVNDFGYEVQDNNSPKNNPMQNWWQSMSGEDKAMLALSGLNGANNLLETNAANKRQHQLDAKLDANNVFAIKPANNASRGDYDTNSGILRPDRYVPVQFAGNQNMRAGYYKHGGSHKPGDEIDMTEEEIAAYIANGGKIERI